MKRNSRGTTPLALGLGMILALGLLARPVRAEISFAGSGLSPEKSHDVSASVGFTISGNQLVVVLTNTSSLSPTLRPTSDQGDSLTGVVFDINGTSPSGTTLSLASIALTSGSAIWTDGSTSNTTDLLADSWTDDLASGAPVDYGVATTGFNGLFNGGSISLGNPSPDYGIVDGTFPGSISGSKFPFIQNSLTFTFDITGTSFSQSDINNVGFLFGTAGGDLVQGSPVQAVPEPSTLVLGCSGLICAGLIALRQRRRGPSPVQA